MPIFDQRTQIVAGDPLEVGGRRLLPSILVQSVAAPTPAADHWLFRSIRMRPISLVEEGPEGARWHAIPNATANRLSTMAFVGLGVAVVSSLILVAQRLLRRAQAA